MSLTISPSHEAVVKLSEIFEKGISEKNNIRASAIFGNFERHARFVCGANAFEAIEYIVKERMKLKAAGNAERNSFGGFVCDKCSRSFPTWKGLHGHQKLHK